MRWNLFHRDEPSPAPDNALRAAEARLREVQQRGPEVSALANEMRRYREENGFTAKIRESMRRI